MMAIVRIVRNSISGQGLGMWRDYSAIWSRPLDEIRCARWLLAWLGIALLSGCRTRKSFAGNARECTEMKNGRHDEEHACPIRVHFRAFPATFPLPAAALGHGRPANPKRSYSSPRARVR